MPQASHTLWLDLKQARLTVCIYCMNLSRDVCPNLTSGTLKTRKRAAADLPPSLSLSFSLSLPPRSVHKATCIVPDDADLHEKKPGVDPAEDTGNQGDLRGRVAIPGPVVTAKQHASSLLSLDSWPSQTQASGAEPDVHHHVRKLLLRQDTEREAIRKTARLAVRTQLQYEGGGSRVKVCP